jgi:hypothetical protein
MEPEGSLLYLHDPATGHYPVSNNKCNKIVVLTVWISVLCPNGDILYVFPTAYLTDPIFHLRSYSTDVNDIWYSCLH